MFTYGVICFGFGASITGAVIAGIAFWNVYKRDLVIDTLHAANKEWVRKYKHLRNAFENAAQ